jgi:hypothetical protein
MSLGTEQTGMGYRCPVCGDPQADGVHLANHLGFTAMLRGGDHEAWLDEHVPDWGQQADEELAAQVTDHATEVEYPQLFEDTTDEHDHEHSDHEHSDHEHSEDEYAHTPASGHVATALDEQTRADPQDTRDVIAEARELTRRRRGTDTEDTDESTADED